MFIHIAGHATGNIKNPEMGESIVGMPTAVNQSSSEAIVLTELRRQLAEVTTPNDALDVRARAQKMHEAFKLMNRSVEECNEFAEVYLLATWRFGDLVKDVSAGAPAGNQNAAG